MDKYFQAIVMAGGQGSKMTELCSTVPKCLLLIGNEPLIMFPLRQLKRAGFRRAFLVCLDKDKIQFQNALRSFNMTIDYIQIPAEEDWGTADTIRHMKDQITKDMLIISGDLIMSTDLEDYFEIFRCNNPTSVSYYIQDVQGKLEKLKCPGPKSDNNEVDGEKIGIEESTNRLVLHLDSSDSENGDLFGLPTKLILKHPNIAIHCKLTDAHLYLLKKWLVNYLKTEKSILSIKTDLMPHLVQMQLSEPSQNIPENPDNFDDPLPEPQEEDIFTYAESPNERIIVDSYSHIVTDRNNSDWIRCYTDWDPSESEEEPEESPFPKLRQFLEQDERKKKKLNKPTPGSYHEINEPLRVNTIFTYCYANKIAKHLLDNEPIHPESKMLCTQYCPETRVASHAEIDGHTSLTRTNIGPGSKIQTKTRLEDCIVMSNVTVEPGCCLINCILCDNCVVGENSNLKNCIVASKFIVPPKATHNNEFLTEKQLMII